MPTPQPTRRHFIAGLSTAAAATWTEQLRAAPEPKEEIIGHGAHRYRVIKDWVTPGQGRNHPILNCHEMVQVNDGRLFMVGDHSDNQMLIYKQDGTILNSWGSSWPGGHGLTHSDENGEEFLFVTDSGLWKSGSSSVRQCGRVAKIDLDGREIFTLSHPMTVGAYEADWNFNPTEVAIGPNGDIYIVDGYGSNYVLRYDHQGKFISRFGGKEGVPPEERLNNAHGIALDTRAGVDQATLIVTSRADNCFRRFTLEGKFVETIATPGAYVCRPVIAGQELYAGVCWSKDKDGKFVKDPSGFVVVIDAQGKVIAAPGAEEPVYDGDQLKPLLRKENVIDHGHDVCVLDNGDLVVCQWNALQTYPIKLEKSPKMHLTDLTWPDVAALDKNTPIIFPIAALEQHGRHMPVFTDSMLAGEIMRRVEAQMRDNILVAPMQWLGNSHHHLDFPGTLSAEPRLYIDLLNGLLENFIAHGFRRLLFFNGHGGNDIPGKQAVFETRQKHRDRKDLLLLSITYWHLDVKPWETLPALQQREMGHACEWETSMVLSLRPDLVKDHATTPEVPFGNPFLPASRGWIMPDRSAPGHVGIPAAATAEKGEHLFQCYTAAAVRFIERVIDWDGTNWEG